METQEATATTPSTPAPLPFADRLRERFSLVQSRVTADAARARAQVASLPEQIRKLAATTPAELAKRASTTADRVRERVLEALDLPSRSDIAHLVERIDVIDRRLAALSGESPLELPTTAETPAAVVAAAADGAPADATAAAATDGDAGADERKKNKRTDKANKVSRRR
jgi:polyhydroxyalkanoate synthesis regulator phasin